MARAVRTPQQARSRRTLERILDAAERLLAERPFEEITVAEIVAESGTSVGSFYARFPAKQALVPALYERRYDPAVLERLGRARRELAERFDSLEAVLREAAARMVAHYRRDRWLLRLMALHARQRPDAVSDETRRRRVPFHRALGEPLLRHRDEIRHPDPERAVQMALFFGMATCRDRILFDYSPHASALGASDEELREEIERMMLAYLTAALPGQPAHPDDATRTDDAVPADGPTDLDDPGEST